MKEKLSVEYSDFDGAFKEISPSRIGEKQWKKRLKKVCKPCWELKYCPYGHLVEQFPLPSPSRKDMVEHDKMLKRKLKEGLHKDNPIMRKLVIDMTKDFNPKDYPKKAETKMGSCSEFGHYCPVYFVNEPFSETRVKRKKTRHIPRATLVRIVRRDNSTCQVCGNILLDKQIEIDHIIPYSKGGPTEEHNLRLICSDCNKKKKDRFLIK